MADKPQTANEVLLDAIIRHQTYLLRYSGYVRNRINGILAETESDIASRIRDRLAGSRGLTTPVEVRRMQSLLAAIDKIRAQAWGEASSWWDQQMKDLSYAEPVVMQGLLAASAPVVMDTVLPAPRLLKEIVTSKPFEGRVLKDWAATMQSEDLRRIHSAIQLGMVSGESSDVIARRVIGTGALNNSDGVLEMTRRQVQAITRTAVQHVANSARDQFMMDNADVLEAEQFVATLDSRTTPICRSLDGKTFPVGKGPRPPLHYACRSLRVAAMDGERLGFRPYKAGTTRQLLDEYTESRKLSNARDRDALPRGEKGKYDEWARKRVRELTGRVPAATTYQQWLKSQTVAFQNDTLGVARGKLFREGGLTLDKFVAANGSELTLKQLAGKYPDAFRTAGLDPTVFQP